MSLLDINTSNELKHSYEKWIEDSLAVDSLKRESKWTESLAIGSLNFANRLKLKLGRKVRYKKIFREETTYILR